ncbi:peptide deformylase, mitochondrial-like isoform X1 [Varroa jacobsoni]|uniref:peptide deformylase, mitochondrial-like isoform X1 n=1 Tax=Varroa jacobsoni TaxID=62625 RepID=UPI000BF26572|nr:peptide deformylase, mitochondrial-like isoform X1 [Varroa jacobsoni]
MAALRKGGSLLGYWKTQLKETYFGINTPKPPFDFAVQVGDPVLRQKADEVKAEDIKSPEIQELISKLVSIMQRNRAYGMAAPQIGVPLQVFVTELRPKEVAAFTDEDRDSQSIFAWNRKVFINPKMTIEDSKKLIFKEACLSIHGYAAHVPRAVKVKVKGLDHNGNPHEWTVSHFGARVVQHEMDHLNGRLFTDIMDPHTFHFMLWKLVQKVPQARKSFGGL